MPPDFVVEAEITHADEGKIGRYGEIGVRELWRLHGRKGSRDLRVEFFALRPGAAPRLLTASEVLGALTRQADDAVVTGSRRAVAVAVAGRHVQHTAGTARNCGQSAEAPLDEPLGPRDPAGICVQPSISQLGVSSTQTN